MDLNEKKVIEDIKNVSSGFKDYNSFAHFNADYRLKKQQQRQILIAAIIAIYIFVIAGFLILSRNGSGTLLWPFATGDLSEITKLESRILGLEKDFKESEIATTTSSPSEMALRRLNQRMSSLEETISLNPEKALTAVLLRERQKNIEDDFIELRNAQVRLDAKVDNFFITVLVGPIIVAILGLIAWFVQNRLSKKGRSE